MLVNKAIAASTAFLYATCLQHHVPEVGCCAGGGIATVQGVLAVMVQLPRVVLHLLLQDVDLGDWRWSSSSCSPEMRTACRLHAPLGVGRCAHASWCGLPTLPSTLRSALPQ